MLKKKQTLVILAFDKTKTPKKKLKKIQKEIIYYLMAQEFCNFVILKEKDKKGPFITLNEKQNKIVTLKENYEETEYKDYLYIDCNHSFFCADFRFFCQGSPHSLTMGLRFCENNLSSIEKKALPKKQNEDPFKKEKVVFFSKDSKDNVKIGDKKPKFLFGAKINSYSNKTTQTIRERRLHRAPCLFLDRDGIIIEDKVYLSKTCDIKFIDGIFDLVRWANHKNWYVIILTNQSGIGRGLYSRDEYLKCEKYIEEKFNERNLNITKTYFSPYHSDSNNKEILSEIYTRKPFPGMLFKATKEYSIDLEKSIMLGDKKSDEFIATSLSTFFLKGNYPVENTKRTFNSLKEILINLKSSDARPV